MIDRSEGRRLFGQDAARYDRARPGHPARVYEVLRERCGLAPGVHVLEVGPGTGQATRPLLELGVERLVALEPDPALASYLETVTGGRLEVVRSTLEESELPTSSFDLGVAASSFHWVDAERGLQIVRTALRPGGWWAMWWTHFGDSTREDPFRDAVDPIVRDLPSSPSAEGISRDAEAGLAALAEAGFESAEHELVRWTQEWDAAGIRSLFATFSPVARVEPARREEILDAVERVATEEFGGRVVKPILTRLYTARRPDSGAAVVH